MENPTNEELSRYIDDLMSSPFAAIKGMPKESYLDFKILHDIKEYAYCVRKILVFLNISSTVRVGLVGPRDVHPSLKGVSENEILNPAWIRMPDPCPMYKTRDFDNMIIHLYIRRWVLLMPPETFLLVISHEMSHVLLKSTWNPHRNSEIATDILSAIILGPEMFSLARKVYQTDYVGNECVTKGEHNFGYLNDEQSRFVCDAIRYKRKFR